MKVKINESQLNLIILETSGYVDNLYKLIDFIYTTYKKYIQTNFIQKYGNDSVNFIEKQYRDQAIIASLSIDEEYLKQLDVSFTNNIKTFLGYYVEDHGYFSPDSMVLNNNKIQTFNIEISILDLIEDIYNGTKETYDTLQHELTHAYTLAQKYVKNGLEHTKNNVNNEYNYSSNAYIKELQYALNYDEVNASVSGLYASLKAYNANRNNYNDIIAKSDIYIKYIILKHLKKIVKNNENNIVEEIMEYAKQNPDSFPKPFNNVEKYKQRIIDIINKKTLYIRNKIHKITYAYLSENLS